KRENTTKYYVGIWFKKVPNDKIVWVANRVYAIETSSALLTIHTDGNIVIMDGQMVYGVTGVPNKNNGISTYATLLDTGNLVLVNTSNQAILWQSFDYPTDTLLPGMNLGQDTDTGHTWSLRSWKSTDDPSPGLYTLHYNFGLASLSVNKGSKLLLIDGNSNFSIQNVINRVPTEKPLNQLIPREKGFNQLNLTQSYNNYFTIGSNSRLVLQASGDLKYEALSKESNRWLFQFSSKCSIDNSCGIFSICNPEADVDPCKCLEGFKPLDADSWRQGNRSAGCVRIANLSCSGNNSKDGFIRFMSVELPPHHVYLQVDAVAQCNSICFASCSCVAYAYDFDGTCMLWNHQVPTLKDTSIDIKDDDDNNKLFFLRLAGSEISITRLESKGVKAWDLWTNDSGMELIDSELDDISSKHLVPRYVNIGLLCVQQSPEDRPTMSDVVSMIGNDTTSLPSPKPPAFQNVRGIVENTRLPKSIEEIFSVNVITDSIVEAR
ncbi:hypothetical protein TSUD_372460, partial [Trifolium subterraneum]